MSKDDKRKLAAAVAKRRRLKTFTSDKAIWEDILREGKVRIYPSYSSFSKNFLKQPSTQSLKANAITKLEKTGGIRGGALGFQHDK